MRDNSTIGRIIHLGSRTAVLGLMITLLACSSAPTYTKQDVALAADTDQLEALFDQVQADLREARPGSDKALGLDLTLRDIAQRLAGPYQMRIESALAQAQQRPLSLEEIDVLEREVEQVRIWLPYDNPERRGEVASLRADTERQIKAARQQLAQLDSEQGGDRYLLLQQLAQLTGGEEGAAIEKQSGEELEMLYQHGVGAVASKRLAKARELLNQVAVADPDYKALVYNQELVATGLFEQHFWQALVDGRPDEAFTLFHEFAETPAFATHRNTVAKDAGELAEYFDALGDKLRRERQWLPGYDAFSKAVYVRNKLDLPSQPSAGMQRYALEMESRFKRANAAGDEAVALAYLSIIERLQPQHPLLDSKKPASYGAVFDRAVVKVSIAPFRGTYGRLMASGVSRYLLDTVPNEVRMVSRQQFQVIADEQTHSAAYFIVEGEILRSDVEQREVPRREQRRVVVGSEIGPNPLYKAWKELPRSERSQLEKPEKEAEIPVSRDVLIKHRDISHKAVLSVSYKVIDPASAKVLFVESMSDSLSAEATATEGLTLGEFVLEAQPARLPAEASLFEKLVGSVADAIGSQLAERVLALESRYTLVAGDEAAQQNYAAATQQWAYAYVVSEPGSDERAQYLLAMERAALQIN